MFSSFNRKQTPQTQ